MATVSVAAQEWEAHLRVIKIDIYIFLIEQ